MPDSLEGCIDLLDRFGVHLEEESQRGEVLRECLSRVEEVSNIKVEKAREENPLAFAKVSYEQALKLNAWVWGINFICDFDANRIGKTAGSVVNAQLWMFPNDPQWKIFHPYIDEWGREVKVLQRPSIQNFLVIQDFLDAHPEMRGDCMKGLDDPENAAKFARLQKLLPEAFQPCWPEPSFTEKVNTLWLGAPDVDYHKNIIMPEWRKWLMKPILRDSEHDKTFDIKITYKTRFGNWREIEWAIICKSYMSQDTKWSGAAVRGIVLTEGFTADTLNEIRQRFQDKAFASWDYTPYEPRNTGQRSALAHRVYQRKEELPLRFHVYSGFGIDKCPSFILPARKKADLIRQWAGKPQGKARIEGKFYSDTPQALSNLDREFHTLPWSVEELFQKIPNGIRSRAVDLGYDHPTVCVWGLLSPNNDWYIYRVWTQSGFSIGERCQKIIELSGNQRYHHRWGNNPDDYYWVEYHPDALKSETYLSTIADYHLFKIDEINKQPYIKNYIKEGLIVRPSVTMRPKDRANEVNRLLEKSQFRKHPVIGRTPGSRIYFLINGEGVEEALEKLENLFWARFLQGEKVGQPKDQLQTHGDDEFDAISYLTLWPIRWSPNIKLVRKEIPEQYDAKFFEKQFKLAA